MNVVFSANRAEFPLSEETGQRDRSNLFLDRPGIVIRLREQPGATTIATEEQCSSRWIHVRSPIVLQQPNQGIVGCDTVTDVELHRLTHAHVTPDRERSVILASSYHVRDQKVSRRKSLLIFVHHDADVPEELANYTKKNYEYFEGGVQREVAPGLGA